MKINKNKTVLMLLFATILSVPAIVFVANKMTNIDDTFALTYSIPDGYTTFTDANFYDCVASKYKSDHPDADISQGLTDAQLQQITGLSCYGKSIANTTGIEKMTALTSLNLHNNQLTEIDVSHNTSLTDLDLDYNKITTIDVSNHPSLKEIDAEGSSLESINVSNTSTLESLTVGGKILYSVNVSGCNNLKYLDVSYFTQGSSKNEMLTELDLSDNVNLETLIAHGNSLSDKDIVINNTKLKRLELGYESTTQGSGRGNNFSEINLSNNTAIETLYLTYNQLSSIDLSHLTKLKTLHISGNHLTSIDLSRNEKLEDLDLGRTRGSTVIYDLGPGHAYSSTEHAGNEIDLLDLSNNPLLTTLRVANNNLSTLNLSTQRALEYLDVGNNELYSLDLSDNMDIAYVDIHGNNLNENNFILAENNSVETLWADGNEFTSLPNDVSSLWFADFSDNNFESFSTIAMPELRGLYISNNNLSSLDISGSQNLVGLSASSCNLTEFDATQNNKLKNLNLSDNAIFDFATIKNIALGGDYSAEWRSDSTKWHSSVYLGRQSQTIRINSRTYSLPPLFSQVKDETFDILYTDEDFVLNNASISADGKTLTILDTTRPASIEVSGGKADGSILKLIYTSVRFTLNYDLNGGTGSISNQTCNTTGTETSCTVTIPSTIPTRDGYTFLGWADTATATTAEYTPGDTITLTADKTIYAVWVQIVHTYTLSFNTNGGTGSISNQTCNAIGTETSCTVTIPSTIPTRDGYTFLGWADTATATTAEYTSGSTITLTADKTIYAVWEEIKVPNTAAPYTGTNTNNGDIVLMVLPIASSCIMAFGIIVHRMRIKKKPFIF
ncbi:InlB B-repeat-containing protein [Candidatus Saccharibacteria bacterium]|nr:InlB B-repeat-containing protein [Candidatus Saccharibacteria bacterium]